METKRPDFLTAYLASLDEEQHDTAPYSAKTFETLEGLDALVGELRAAAERVYGRQVVLAVVSDHGHIEADRELHVNAALHEAGLLDLNSQGKVTAWRAFAWSAGGSAGIVLQDPTDAGVRQQVGNLLHRLAGDPGNGIAQVVDGAGLKALGAMWRRPWQPDWASRCRRRRAATGSDSPPPMASSTCEAADATRRGADD